MLKEFPILGSLLRQPLPWFVAQNRWQIRQPTSQPRRIKKSFLKKKHHERSGDSTMGREAHRHRKNPEANGNFGAIRRDRKPRLRDNERDVWMFKMGIPNWIISFWRNISEMFIPYSCSLFITVCCLHFSRGYRDLSSGLANCFFAECLGLEVVNFRRGRLCLCLGDSAFMSVAFFQRCSFFQRFQL